MTEDDLKKYKQLKAVLLKGSYDLKGDAITLVASLLLWYESLGEKIQDSIKKKPITAKKIKQPIKKVGE